MELPIIYGFNGSSDIGENPFGVSIFLSGCNLRCPYCMNARLVTKENLKPFPIEDVKKFVLENNRKWVTISGGEPTLNGTDSLLVLFNEIKSWGCKIGLSTNGTRYETLSEIIEEVDYVALDVKTSRHELVYPPSFFISVIRSLSFLNDEKINRKDFDYEIRTTLYSSLVDKGDIYEISQILRKDDKWVLQQFRLAKNRLVINDVKPYSDEEVEALLKIAREYIPRTSVSYV